MTHLYPNDIISPHRGGTNMFRCHQPTPKNKKNGKMEKSPSMRPLRRTPQMPRDCVRLHIVGSTVESLFELWKELPVMGFGGCCRSGPDSEGVDGNYWWERYLRHTSPEGITNQKSVSGKVALTGAKRSAWAPADRSFGCTEAETAKILSRTFDAIFSPFVFKASPPSSCYLMFYGPSAESKQQLQSWQMWP